jgi:hypothetical protein
MSVETATTTKQIPGAIASKSEIRIAFFETLTQDAEVEYYH